RVDVAQDRSWASEGSLRSAGNSSGSCGRRMTAIVEVDQSFPSTTDGEIAAINLESARRSAWARLARGPRLAGAAEAAVDHENWTAQSLGDLHALDRLEALASQLASAEDSSRAALVQAQVASTAHRFRDARSHLARAALMGGPSEDIERHALTI